MNDEKSSDRSRVRRPWARPRDFLLLGVMAVVALALILLPQLSVSSDEIELLVYHEGRVIDRFILEEGTGQVFSYAQYPEIEIQQWSDCSVAIIRSDCPDQLCVKTGRIRLAGQFSACLPNNFVIVLKAVSDVEGVDAVA